MDLLPQYINRKHGRESIEYDHPDLEPILRNTYGIGVYQEQMMQIAQKLANYTLAQADALRKAIGKKDVKLLEEQQKKIIDGMIENNIDKKLAKKIWNLFPPFARYGFNRSHAACYARIAYQTAYLKAHYPTEFMVALLNAEVKNIERLSFLIVEATEHNINILPPSIQESGVIFTKVKDNTIRFGLSAIKNVGTAVVEQIIKTRTKDDTFQSLDDFLDRMSGYDLNKKSLESLIKTGAFDDLGERNTLLFNIQMLLDFMKEKDKMNSTQQGFLFDASSTAETSSLQLEPTPPVTDVQKLNWEKELVGFYMSGHPLQQHKELLSQCTNISLLESRKNLSVQIAALVSSTKKITTKKGEPMLFFSAEDLTGKVEAIAFPALFEQHQQSLETGKIVHLTGKMSEKNGETKFLCERVREVV